MFMKALSRLKSVFQTVIWDGREKPQADSWSKKQLLGICVKEYRR